MRVFSLSGQHDVLSHVAIVVAVALSFSSAGSHTSAQVVPADRPPAVDKATDPFAPFIAEAALRFAIPERWIRVVLHAESHGDVRAISSRGAAGLMQLMPATWNEMRARYALGPDPHVPRDNIMAGAAYLRMMHDQFGAPGFLAAYNAGPARYREHLSTGRPLPAETRLYLARLAPLIGFGAPSGQHTTRAPDPRPWPRASIFVRRSKAQESNQPTVADERELGTTAIDPAIVTMPDRSPTVRPRRSLEGVNTLNSNGLFVSPSREKR